MWAPTQMPEPSSHFSTKAMDAADIRATIDGFAVSARNAVEGGFDGIEIKIAHDGLLRSFASPFFNRRTDGYGGSFENRMRLSYEVLEAIQRRRGDDVPVGVRICLDEFTAFGYDLDYGLQMVRALEATGLRRLFQRGCRLLLLLLDGDPACRRAHRRFRAPEPGSEGDQPLPVVAFGRISPLAAARRCCARGVCDMIGMARQLIADPDTPNKLMAGRADLVRMCVACNDACIFQVGQEKAIRCIHNPGAGRERRDQRALSARGRTGAARRRRGRRPGRPEGRRDRGPPRPRRHGARTRPQLGGQVRLAAGQPEHAHIAGVAGSLEASLAEPRRHHRPRPHRQRPQPCGAGARHRGDRDGIGPNLPRPNMPDGGAPPLSLGMGRTVLRRCPGSTASFVDSSDDVMSGAATCAATSGGRRERPLGGGRHRRIPGRPGLRVTITLAQPYGGGSRRRHPHAVLSPRRDQEHPLPHRHDGDGDRAGAVQIRPVFGPQPSDSWDRYLIINGEPERLAGVDAVVAVIGRRSREDLFHACKEFPGLAGVRVERVGYCVAPRLVEGTLRKRTFRHEHLTICNLG